MPQKIKLVICCHHIMDALKTKKKIKKIEVLNETFACPACAKNQPKTEKEFMDMFITVCEHCLKDGKN